MVTAIDKQRRAYDLLDGVLEIARSIKSPELFQAVAADGVRVDPKSFIARAVEAELYEAIEPLVAKLRHPKVLMVPGCWDHRRALYDSRDRQIERAEEADKLKELLVFVQNSFGDALPYSYTEMMETLFAHGHTVPGLADE